MSEADLGRPENPWPRYISFATTGAALPASLIGTYALWERNRSKLPIWGGLWATLATVSRKHICARCPYYGEYCSTLFGKITPLIWPRSDEPLNSRGFYWDIVLAPALFLLPLPEAHRLSRRFLAAYLAAWALFLATMHSLACRRCPLNMCPFNPNR